MESRYDAFISYRHAVKDTQMAAEIQKSLEHFDIPIRRDLTVYSGMSKSFLSRATLPKISRKH